MCSVKRLLILLLLAVGIGHAQAQSNPGFTANQTLGHLALNAAFSTKLDASFGVGNGLTLGATTLNNGILNNVNINSGNLLGTLNGGTLNGTTLVNATFIGSTGTPNQTSVSCGTSNTLLLSASSAIAFIAAKIPASAASTVWFNWSGTNAVAAVPSMDISPGQEIVWSTSNGFLPTSAVNCISGGGGAVTVTLLWK